MKFEIRPYLYTFIYSTIFCTILTTYGWANNAMGPLRTRNDFPPYFMFLLPVKDTPQLLPRGELKLSAACDYSNVFVNDEAEDWGVLIDMETTVVNTSMAIGVSRYLTLTLEAAWVNLHDGFMDGFLNDYHDTLNLPNYHRETRPNNTFGYEITYRGRDWFRAPSRGFHLIDSTLTAKVPLLFQDLAPPLALSLAYALKMPTGDYEYGLGSGHFDHGLFVLGQLDYNPYLIYFHTGYLMLSKPKTIGAEIDVANVPSIFLGLEYLFNAKVSLLTQVNYFMSPFDAPRITQMDSGGGEFDFGLIYRFRPKVQLEFVFTEDIFGTGAPDFNLHLRTTMDFL